MIPPPRFFLHPPLDRPPRRPWLGDLADLPRQPIDVTFLLNQLESSTYFDET